MAFLPGLKKQLNKANQFMSEKISGVEGTKLDDDFQTMERKTDLFNELVEDLQIKTKEFLQPNPTVRAKMAAVKGISKLSGQAKASTYPQPEGTLGDAMSTYGNKLQDFDSNSVFATSLVEAGEALKQMADLKYALDDNVKQNYLEPLHQLQSKDLKEVAHHRKKLQGRKLDYDCKKRKQQSGGQVPDKEIKMAEDKFSESLHLAQMGMHNIMENDIEQISQLMQYAEALLEYHNQCSEILQGLTETLYTKTNDASSRPRRDFTPKTLEDLGVEMTNDFSSHPGAERAMRSASSSRSGSGQRSSSVVRSGSGGSMSASVRAAPSTRPTSQPSFGGSVADLDPWDNAEQRASAPAAPTAHTPANPKTLNNNHTGWTVFPTNSPSPAPRAAWGNTNNSGGQKPQVAQKPSTHHNGFSQFSNIQASGNLISPGGSPAGTPTHAPGYPSGQSSGFNSASPRPSPIASPTKQQPPSCQALYDFEPENAGELGFREGDSINLIQKVDDNWFEGSIHGKTGYFPINYVTVVVPLP